ncbi:hypothetical protein SAY87_017184 [Trapa incisa]|uniref:GDSL esterase/lipase n=1 Tax=Trapa incisa TaxID=236973 RepID=A0AAN7L2L2_9MYRT|nr:hypothetical protein SAY87_017184 [Trapa incisa]
MSVKDELWQGVEDKQTPPATGNRTRSRQPNEPKEGSHILPETQERRHTGRSGGGFGRHRLPGSGGGGLGGDDDAGPGPASAVLVLLDGGVEGFEMAPAPSPCVLPALLADHLVAHSFFSFFFVLVSFLRFGKAAASSFLTADGWKTGDEQLMLEPERVLAGGAHNDAAVRGQIFELAIRIELDGEMLGQPNFASPFLAPNTTGKAILYGVNYASGGGGILNATGRIFVNRLSMDIQVDYFNITRKQMDNLLGSSRAKDYMGKNSIFSITIGANDFLNNYMLPILSIGARIIETPDAFIDDMISHLRNQLTLNQDECVELPNKLARQYNIQLKALLTELNQNLPGSTYVYANVYDLVMELITNYDKYGFTTASRACCGNRGQFAGIIPCGLTSSMCDDRSSHVFWDPYHPSEAANLFLAKQLLDGPTKYISPMNLRQLRGL